MDRNNSTQIALMGATGKAGAGIAAELLARGYAVKALVRDISRLHIPEQEGLTILRGDAMEGATLDELLRGCATVINATSNARNPAPISSRLTHAILERLGERRYFLLSGKTVKAGGDSFSARTAMERPCLRAMFPAIVGDKQREYEILAGSAAGWTLLRCPLIVDGEDGAYEASLESCGGKAVTKKAIAACIMDELGAGRFVRRAPFLYSAP